MTAQQLRHSDAAARSTDDGDRLAFDKSGMFFINHIK
jgi:hypothetical protein